MKPAVVFFVCIAWVGLCCTCQAQETAEPYSARAYWLEEHNTRYQSLLQKQDSGVSLTDAENEWLKDYTIYLQNYFAKLSADEKNKYRQFSTEWNDALMNRKESPELVEENARGVVPPRKFMLYNGFYGFGYGLAIDGIFSIEGAGAAAVPFITSGISLLWPVIDKDRYKNINFSTIMLARHGKFVGVLHGAAISLAIFGNEPDAPEILAPMLLTSMALGEVGFQLGKNKNWSEGRVATYKYYGILSPFLVASTMVIAHVENARPYGIAVPLSAAAGYLWADKIYRKNQFTRGDMLAASSFELLSAGLGFGVVPLEHEEDMIAPLVTTVAGSILNHSILKYKHLTARQGWNVNYFTAAGVVLGLGTVLLFHPETHNAYFILPACTGSIGWFGALAAQTKKRTDNLGLGDHSKNAFSVRLMPENYFINKKIPAAAPGKLSLSLPQFQMSMNFN